MGSITGGVISIEDGTKKSEEYAPPRKVKVEFRFEVEQGGDADAMIALTSDKANAKVAELLGAPAPAPAGKKAAVKPPKPAEEKKPADAPAAEVKKPEDTSMDDILAPTPKPAPPPEEKKPEDKPREITDAELLSAVSKRNGETKNPAAIKAKAKEFSTTGRVVEIPQDKREDFLKALKAIEVVGA